MKDVFDQIDISDMLRVGIINKQKSVERKANNDSIQSILNSRLDLDTTTLFNVVLKCDNYSPKYDNGSRFNKFIFTKEPFIYDYTLSPVYPFNPHNSIDKTKDIKSVVSDYAKELIDDELKFNLMKEIDVGYHKLLIHSGVPIELYKLYREKNIKRIGFGITGTWDRLNEEITLIKEIKSTEQAIMDLMFLWSNQWIDYSHSTACLRAELSKMNKYNHSKTFIWDRNNDILKNLNNNKSDQHVSINVYKDGGLSTEIPEPSLIQIWAKEDSKLGLTHSQIASIAKEELEIALSKLSIARNESKNLSNWLRAAFEILPIFESAEILFWEAYYLTEDKLEKGEYERYSAAPDEFKADLLHLLQNPLSVISLWAGLSCKEYITNKNIKDVSNLLKLYGAARGYLSYQMCEEIIEEIEINYHADFHKMLSIVFQILADKFFSQLSNGYKFSFQLMEQRKKMDDIYDVVYEKVGLISAYFHAKEKERHFITPEFIVGVVLNILIAILSFYGGKKSSQKDKDEILNELKTILDGKDKHSFSNDKETIIKLISNELTNKNVPKEVAQKTAFEIVIEIEIKYFSN